MNLKFEQRLKKKENTYLEKYSKETAYKKLNIKYSRYLNRFNYHIFHIFAFLIQFIAIFFVVALTRLSFNIYVILYLSLVGVIIVSYIISLSLFHFKNKKLLRDKLKEWNDKINIIEEDQD